MPVAAVAEMVLLIVVAAAAVRITKETAREAHREELAVLAFWLFAIFTRNMAHYAQLNDNNVVTQVVVVSDDEADPQTFLADVLGHGGIWIQTSYNTRGGVHYGQDNLPDDKPALRKNYAGIGYSYDSDRDAFIPPKPFPSWSLDEQTCWWKPPVPRPDGLGYVWNEGTQQWDKR